ncbi:MAG: high-potential iron-sulfur protein [Sulfuritalea sp.]|nr:high-potential iron-sulfur protein [Sulfuritalea sp.]
MDQSRRKMLKLGGAALAMIPVVAFAAKNDAMRTSMKYKDSPEGDKSCATCVQFVPGKAPADKGGCKIFPGDTEVSPKGYCVAWAKKA